MRAKSMVLILIALGCGLVASIAISQVMERDSNGETAKLETVQIYVALSDIDVNEQLTANNVRLEDWPKSKVPEGSIVNFEEIHERFARTRMYEGEPVLRRKLADSITGPAITIPAGHRVCSLKVRMDTAVSYLVNPGDRVDIYGYFRQGKDIPKTGTREILRNVRLFAVNSETEQETDQEGRTIVAKTVSVLVKQDQVARLMLAAELGTLRLALRRPNETHERNNAEEASIETLFGQHSESADEEQKPSKTLSAAGGFVKFLSGLGQKSPAAATYPVNMMPAMPRSQEPEWQMTLLTPDGGTEFTWRDGANLPETGNPGLATPSNPFAPATRAQPGPPTWQPSPAPASGAAADPVPGDQPLDQDDQDQDNTTDFSVGDDD
jgi:pilus assembly protein CpaB